MPKVLVLTGDAESLEVMYPYSGFLRRATRSIWPRPRRRSFSSSSTTSSRSRHVHREAGYTWDADLAFADVDPSDYVALVVPGGRAPEYIRNDADAQEIIRHFFEDEKPVAQLCHARSRSRRRGCWTDAALRRIRTSSPTWGRPAPSSSTARQWSTVRWCRRARGPTIRNGCANSSRC